MGFVFCGKLLPLPLLGFGGRALPWQWGWGPQRQRGDKRLCATAGFVGQSGRAGAVELLLVLVTRSYVVLHVGAARRRRPRSEGNWISLWVR